ncbi:hypothetical conserved protein [Candidatus Nitrosoglobus terrae]|uniref:Hypothetical conserved protein n=1 Tax=Candidatus Nitrosoglobus terrae TaxID=1630141 RepID=A0A1Q2SPL5_9GAMM|nr:hypothetical conserved protein [Candidatus Nitrosoglobus terrae]
MEKETPPRAWGRRLERITELKKSRNTPTGVGKTKIAKACKNIHEKHPHGRGEDTLPILEASEPIETPPRAWGRLCTR